MTGDLRGLCQKRPASVSAHTRRTYDGSEAWLNEEPRPTRHAISLRETVPSEASGSVADDTELVLAPAARLLHVRSLSPPA
jgi:hypothetical protein